MKANQTQPFVNPPGITLIGKTDANKRGTVLNVAPVRSSLRKGDEQLGC